MNDLLFDKKTQAYIWIGLKFIKDGDTLIIRKQLAYLIIYVISTMMVHSLIVGEWMTINNIGNLNFMRLMTLELGYQYNII